MTEVVFIPRGTAASHLRFGDHFILRRRDFADGWKNFDAARHSATGFDVLDCC